LLPIRLTNSASHGPPQSASQIGHDKTSGSIRLGSVFLTLPTRALTSQSFARAGPPPQAPDFFLQCDHTTIRGSAMAPEGPSQAIIPQIAR
jgi:hypothetical protein